MKATVKDTGKVINVVSYKGASEMWQNIQDENELYHTLELEFADSDMPSEKRMRYELAKSAMQGYCIALGLEEDSDTYRNIAIGSIRVAEEIIKQLKESEAKK